MSELENRKCVVSDFDHRDRESAYSPWSRWAQLRRQASIPWSEKHDGFFVLSRYKDIFDAVRDPQTFSSHLKSLNIPSHDIPDEPPITYDPPEHGSYREIVNPFFTPAKIAEFEQWIRETAKRYTDRLLQWDSFDVVKDLAAHVTKDVVLHVIGIVDPPVDLRKWVDDLALNTGNPLAAQRFLEFVSAEIEKRRGSPSDDIIGALLKAKLGDHRSLTQGEIVNMLVLLMVAGMDTTTSAIGGSVWYLVQNPDAQKKLLAADEGVWRLALDEFVRWVSPVAGLARTVRNDTEFHGCPMHAGDRVFLLWGSGNRDETEFPDPDKVILDRFPNRHMGFGMGLHRCLGSHLAKATLQAVLKVLLKDLSNFRLTGLDDIVWEAAEVRGIKSLPLVRK